MDFGGQKKPTFFNSKNPAAKGQPKETVPILLPEKKVEQKPEIKFQKEPEIKQHHLVKPTNDDEKEESLTREMQKKEEKLPHYKIDDGKFENFPEISQKSVDKFRSRGIASLFPIQYNCFYPVYNREDMIARDLTGSGKTLAFGLPIIEYLRKIGSLGSHKIQLIVLVPTRELALQVTLFRSQNNFSFPGNE